MQTVDDSQDMENLGRPMPGSVSPGDSDNEGGEDVPVKVNYPTIHVELDHAIDFPDGEFHFVAVGRLDHDETSHPDPEGEDPKKFCYDIEIRAISPPNAMDDDAGEEDNEPVDSADDLEQKLMGGK